MKKLLLAVLFVVLSGCAGAPPTDSCYGLSGEALEDCLLRNRQQSARPVYEYYGGRER